MLLLTVLFNYGYSVDVMRGTCWVVGKNVIYFKISCCWMNEVVKNVTDVIGFDFQINCNVNKFIYLKVIIVFCKTIWC